MKFLLFILITFYFVGCGGDAEQEASGTTETSSGSNIAETNNGSNTAGPNKGSNITEPNSDSNVAEKEGASGTTKTSSGSNIAETSGINDESDPFFTITHNTTNEEEVYIFLSTFPQNDLDNYIVQPSDCFKVRESLFPKLEVKFGKGGFSKDTFYACSPLSNPCKANHYEVVNLGEPIVLTDYETWQNKDLFALVPTDQPNTSESCIDIRQWIVLHD